MLLQKFMSDERGTIAVMVAIGAGCLLMVVGAAIEMSAFTAKREKLQAAADFAVLAAATSGEIRNNDMAAVAADVAQANFEGEHTLTFETTGDDLVINMSTDHEMIVMGAFGYRTKKISVVAGSQAGTGGKINIALALDTTGSMAGVR